MARFNRTLTIAVTTLLCGIKIAQATIYDMTTRYNYDDGGNWEGFYLS